MGHIEGPGRIYPPHPQNENRIKEIKEREAREPKGRRKSPPPQKEAMLYRFFKLCKEFLSSWFKKGNPHKKYEALFSDISEIERVLSKLKKKDCSRDIQLLTALTESWHRMVEHGFLLIHDANAAPMLDLFVREIEEYPEGAFHTLGYYFLEYAGSKWIPFPFMDLLKELHEAHIKQPQTSHLSKWTDRLAHLMKHMER